MKITKEQIKTALLRGHTVKLHAVSMVGGAVTIGYEVDYNRVVITGIVTSTENSGFDSVDDVVSYIYKERARIIWYH